MPTFKFYNYPKLEAAVGREARQADLDAAASGYGPGYCPEGIPIEQANEIDHGGNKTVPCHYRLIVKF